MTKIKDSSINNSSNNENDLSNNDLSNNDLSNNDLSNNDLDLFKELDILHSNKDKLEIESSDDDEEEIFEKLDEQLYYNYLDDGNNSKDDLLDDNEDLNNEIKDNNVENEKNEEDEEDEEFNPEKAYYSNLNRIDDLLKLVDEMYVLDSSIKKLDNFMKKTDENKENDKNNKKIKLSIKDKDKNKNMKDDPKKNNKFNDMLKEMDKTSNLNNPYYNVNDLLFLNNNNNKIYKNTGTSTNLNYINPPKIKNIVSIDYKKHIENKSLYEPLEESYEPIEKEKINVEADINNIDDLISMIEKYPLDKYIEYNINMKAMHDIKPDLIELNKMIGMHNLKMNIVDQILYFIQDLHINELKKKEKEIEKKKESIKKKQPTIGFNGQSKLGTGGLFSGLDLSSAFGINNKEPICIDNDNSDYLHTVIYGPPGTGKTEVAKIMGKIFSKLGVLKKGFFKKATRSDFVAGYLGQTAMKTKDLIDECLGGVLFIDEAYSLGNNEGKDSFAKEAIDTLCESLSNHKNDIMVIIAGYEKELNDCFFSFNQGLESRFPWRFKTEDYKPEELKLIFKKQVLENNWKINDNDLKDEWFNSKMTYFKNYGRDMETLFSKVKIAHGRRIFCNLDSEKKLLTERDLDKGFDSYLENENKDRIEKEMLTKQIRDSIYL